MLSRVTMGRSKAFTLVEALVAVFIAGIVTVGVFGYFSDSIRGVAHTTETLETLFQLQQLARKTRHLAYNVTPFNGGVGIDLFEAGPNFPIYKRPYTYELVNTTSASETVVSVVPAVKTYRKSFKDGKPYLETKRTVDQWFFTKTPLPFGQMAGFEDGLVVFKRKLPGKGSEEVTEHYLFTENRKMLLRHYPPPESYVEFYDVNRDGKETLLESFGKKKKNIVHFSLNPVFELAYFKPDESEPDRALEFLRYFIDVKIGMETGGTKRGPRGGLFELHFRVINLYCTANRYGRGIF